MNKIILIIFVVIVITGLGGAAFYLLTRTAPQLPQQTPAPLEQTPFPTIYPFGSTTPFPLVGLPSPSPTQSATPSATLIASASATPRVTVTPTPTAAPTAAATLPPDVPVSGVEAPTIIGIAAGLILLLIGTAYFQLGNQ